VLVFQVLVDDGNGEQDVDSVTVTVTPNGGQSGGKDGGSNDGEKGCAVGDHPYDRALVLILLMAGALTIRRVKRARQ
jgi:MYXO-CTERM domain-containing protein